MEIFPRNLGKNELFCRKLQGIKCHAGSSIKSGIGLKTGIPFMFLDSGFRRNDDSRQDLSTSSSRVAAGIGPKRD